MNRQYRDTGTDAEIRSSVSGRNRPASWRVASVLGVVVMLVHIAAGMLYLDHPPHYDEMYHLLAAESWRESGEMRILDGEYTRASLFTRLVGIQGSLCGPSPECARSLSLAAAAVLVLLATVMSARLAGSVAGGLAGFMLALNPGLVSVAQLVRFYSLHGLAFFVFAMAVYILVLRWRERKWVFRSIAAGLAGVSLLFANHLQPVTQVGLAGVFLGAGLVGAPDLLAWTARQRRAVVVFLVVGLLALFAGALYWVDFAEKIQRLREAPGWAGGLESQYLYYHYTIEKWYPVLWPLAPLLCLLSIGRWPRLSLYSVSVFAVCFLLLSLAGTKAPRYIVFALPFLFIPLAGGVAVLGRILIRFLFECLDGWSLPRLDPKIGRVFVIVAVSGAAGCYLLTQPVFRSAARMAYVPGYVVTFGSYGNTPDWPAAARELRRLAKQYPTVLSSAGVKAAYYLGDFSFELNHSVMLESDTGTEFGLDRRTGRRTVSSPASVAAIVAECAPLLVIAENNHINDPRQVSAETVSLLDQAGVRRDMDGKPHLYVWTIPAVSATDGDFQSGSAPDSLDCKPVNGAIEHARQ